MNPLKIAFLTSAGLAILAWLALALRGPPKVQTRNVIVVLRYGSVERIGAMLLALVPPMLMSYVLCFFQMRNDATLAIAGTSFLATCLLAGLLVIEAERAQVVLSEDGIMRHSPWLGAAALKWTEIERVRYSSLNRWFVVEGMGRTIRVSRHLAGIKTFAEAVRTRVPPERWVSALAVLSGM